MSCPRAFFLLVAPVAVVGEVPLGNWAGWWGIRSSCAKKVLSYPGQLAFVRAEKEQGLSVCSVLIP